MSYMTGAPLPDFQLPYTSHASKGQNGRVNLRGGSSTGTALPDDAGFRYPVETEVSFAGDMLRGNWEHTPLSDAFFTRRNAAILQQRIRNEVYRISGPKKYMIDDQDVDELKMIMRAMYLQYAKNNPFHLEGQIRELNDMVVQWAAPRIVSEIQQYNYYLNDSEAAVSPSSRAISVSFSRIWPSSSSMADCFTRSIRMRKT